MKTEITGPDEAGLPVLVWHCSGCKGGHGVPVKPTHEAGKRGWGWNGDRERPTLTPSVKVSGGEYRDGGLVKVRDTICHFFLVDGVQQFLGDCTHALAGQNVPLEDID